MRWCGLGRRNFTLFHHRVRRCLAGYGQFGVGKICWNILFYSGVGTAGKVEVQHSYSGPRCRNSCGTVTAIDNFFNSGIAMTRISMGERGDSIPKHRRAACCSKEARCRSDMGATSLASVTVDVRRWGVFRVVVRRVCLGFVEIQLRFDVGLGQTRAGVMRNAVDYVQERQCFGDSLRLLSTHAKTKTCRDHKTTRNPLTLPVWPWDICLADSQQGTGSPMRRPCWPSPWTAGAVEGFSPLSGTDDECRNEYQRFLVVRDFPARPSQRPGRVDPGCSPHGRRGYGPRVPDGRCRSTGSQGGPRVAAGIREEDCEGIRDRKLVGHCLRITCK